MDASLALLADYATSVDAAALDAATLHACRRRVIDTFGCALAAVNEAPVRMARAAALRAPGEASLVGHGARVQPEWAAFVNGIAVRCLEGNDCALGGGGHPSDAIMGLLALAQSRGSDARTALAGVLTAYEVHVHLHQRVPVREQGIDPPFYTGMATAAGASVVLGLPRGQAAQALSLAAMSQLGLEVSRRGAISMWKGCAGANAARNAVFGALLAREGMTAPESPFDGVHGLWSLLGPHRLGPLPAGERPAMFGVSYKHYLTEYHSQAAIMAALELREEIGFDRIASVEIEIYRFAWSEIGSGAEKWRPATRETADHSLPYIVAASLVDGAFSDAIFDASRFNDPRILALIDRVSVSENPEFTATFPHAVPCCVTLVDTDGARHALEVRYPLGHPGNPMSDGQLADKFLSLANRSLPAGRAGQVLELLWQLGEGVELDEVFQAADPSSAA
jgi:2-methylcitrate dehydratase